MAIAREPSQGQPGARLSTLTPEECQHEDRDSSRASCSPRGPTTNLARSVSSSTPSRSSSPTTGLSQTRSADPELADLLKSRNRGSRADNLSPCRRRTRPLTTQTQEVAKKSWTLISRCARRVRPGRVARGPDPQGRAESPPSPASSRRWSPRRGPSSTPAAAALARSCSHHIADQINPAACPSTVQYSRYGRGVASKDHRGGQGHTATVLSAGSLVATPFSMSATSRYA